MFEMLINKVQKIKSVLLPSLSSIIMKKLITSNELDSFAIKGLCMNLKKKKMVEYK